MSTSVFVITHKKFNVITKEPYKILLVGKRRDEEYFESVFFTDDEGENISDKNQNFCEITGLYWIWKNCNSEIQGLVHYRRYFCTNWFNKRNSILLEKEIDFLMEEYDIILPPKKLLYASVEYDYGRHHIEKDYYILREIISEKHPDYLPAFDAVSKKHLIYTCNMMICKKKLLNTYCEWLFDILFEAERRIDINQYDSVQRRIFGYMAERLLNVWVNKNNLNIKELPMYQTELNRITETKRCLYLFCRYVFQIDPYTFHKERKLTVIHEQRN